MGGQTYKIKPLKGTKNYDRWSEDIQVVLALDHCWLVTIGKEITLNLPRGLPEEKPASTGADGEIIPGITVTEEMKDAYKARMERYGDKLFDCDDKYSRACAKIRLNCEDGPRVHIKVVDDPNEMWSTLKRQNKAFNLATRDNAVSPIIFPTQSDFKTIAEYRESIKQGEAKCAEMGNPVASWLQSSFFRLGFNSDLEPYTFQMVNTARVQKRELEIDEMIIALVDHDRRLQFSGETKALATKLSHKKNSEKRKSQEIPTPSSSAWPAKKYRGKSLCDHFCSARHGKKSCYFLFPADE